MALIGNYSVLLKSCGRFRSGSTVADNRAAYNNNGAMRNVWLGEAGGWSQLSAVPRGYTPGQYAWAPPLRGGGMSTVGEGSLVLQESTLNVAAGKNTAGDATLTLQDSAAQLQLVVSANGTATLTLSTAGNAAGVLSAVGSATFVLQDSAALLAALAGLQANGTITLTGSSLISAIGALAGDILPYTELSPQNLAIAVWDKVISGTFTTGDLLKVIAAATAGKSSGGPGSPVFRDLPDSQNVITGTADSNGNRTAATYTP